MILSSPIRSTVLAIALAITAGTVPAPAAEGVLVIVSKATNACFSDRVRVAGFLVPQTEAVATVDSEGYKITEVLAGEGDTITSGQTLARLSRTTPQGTSAAILKAPVGGMVIRRATMVGSYASPQAEPLFRIMVDNKIDLEVEVPSMHLPKLKPGATARIAVEDGPELNGRVRVVSGEIDRRGQLGKVRLSLDNDSALRIGMFAHATIDASRSCGVSIPRSAVINRTEGAAVQIVRDGRIETRPVKIGLHSDTNTEVREGLRQDDIVVANAGASLRDGDLVKPIFVDEAEQRRAR